MEEIRESKMDELREKAYVKWLRTKEWCIKHKEMIVVFGPVIAGGVVEILKMNSKRHTVNEEKRLKDCYIYDRSNGHYYETKRKIRSAEWIQIEQRKNNGESIGMILDDMGLLK